MKITLRGALALFVLVLTFAVGMASLLNYFKFESTVRALQSARIQLVAGDIEDSIQKSLAFSSALAENTTLPPLIARSLQADPLILSIDVLDDAGHTLFSSEPGRQNQLAPARWQAMAQRAPRTEWLLQEDQAFVAGLNVINSFGVRVATVVVRYRREGFDATVAKVGGEIARGGVAALATSLALAALLLPLLIKSRKGAAQ